MGILAKTLTSSSAYAARNAGLWPELMDRLEACLYPAAIDVFEEYVTALGLQIPDGWQTHIAEAVERKRQEIEGEDITQIMRDRFDF